MRGLDVLGTRPPPAATDDSESDDEAELVVLARQRDARAVASLYRRYVDPVYRYCYRRLGSVEAAEDATSLVFAKALAALPRYHDRAGSFRSWLFTIAHNVIADSFRHQRPETPLLEAMELIDAEPTPEEAALVAETRQTVRDLLARLPEEQRRIVELRLAGQTGPEIAATLGRSLASVKFAQHQAYTRLRTLLGVPATSEEARDGDR